MRCIRYVGRTMSKTTVQFPENGSRNRDSNEYFVREQDVIMGVALRRDH